VPAPAASSWSASSPGAPPRDGADPEDAAQHCAPRLTRLQAAERAALLRAMEELHGNMSRVAAELGVSRNTLYRKIKRHGIAPVRRG
jgi:transcriptional regulator of acetoin/glycerol metabolism